MSDASGFMWGADTPISTPEPPDNVVVDFGGFGFSTGGLVHTITETEVEAFYAPFYRPAPPGEGG
jgi:hypothetical protein